jgi:hypothetical protein
VMCRTSRPQRGARANKSKRVNTKCLGVEGPEQIANPAICAFKREIESIRQGLLDGRHHLLVIRAIR